MLENQKLKVSLYVIMFIAVFIYFALQIHYHFFTIDHISWLGTFDGDIVYQVDRLLLDSNFPDYKQIASINVDYGPELYFLAPFAKIFYLLFGNNTLYSYFTLTGFHILCGSLAIFILSKSFADNFLEKNLWIILVILSPLFGFYHSYIKPDASFVLLSISLSLHYLFKATKEEKYYTHAIFFSGLGFAIKWWGLFMFPVIIIIMIYLKNLDNDSLKKIVKVSTLIALILLMPISFKLMGEIKQILIDNHYNNFVTRAPLILLSIALWLAFILPSVLTFLIFAKTSYRKLSITAYVTNLFTTSYLMTALPFFFSGIFIKSMWYFFIQMFLRDKMNSGNRVNAWGTIHFWINEFKDYHYFSPVVLVLLLGVAVYVWRKKIEIPSYTKIIYLFLTFYTLFIFLVLNRNNRAMIGMLYPLYMLAFIQTLMILKPLRVRVIAVLLFVSFQAYYHHDGADGDLFKIYFQRDMTRGSVSELSALMNKEFPDIKKVYTCDYGFPASSEYMFEVEFLWRYGCKDIYELIKKLNTGESIVTSEEFFTASNLPAPETMANLRVGHFEKKFFNRSNRPAIKYVLISNK